jgi:hypothetical protein
MSMRHVPGPPAQNPDPGVVSYWLRFVRKKTGCALPLVSYTHPVGDVSVHSYDVAPPVVSFSVLTTNGSVPLAGRTEKSALGGSGTPLALHVLKSMKVGRSTSTGPRPCRIAASKSASMALPVARK